MLEDYLDVKTGQDLIDKGVVPKDSSSHLALIVFKRLKALRDHTLASLTDEILGRWQPLVRPETTPFAETSDPSEIQRTVQIGYRVEGTGIYDNNDLTGLKGTIRTSADRRGQYGIEWDQPILRGTNLDGTAKAGHGWYTSPSAFKLLAGHKVMGHALVEGVVADKNLGHHVRFAKLYKGTASDSRGSTATVQIPEDTRGMVTEYHSKNGTVTITLSKALPDQGTRVVYNMPVSDLEKIVEVSSLGQIEPLEKEKAVNRQVLYDFFPTTALDTSLSELVILSSLIGKDLIFYGPAGSGKTNLVRDIIGLAKQQRYIFTVDGCQVQCNPFSLFDEAFAKVVPPCPECRINYDPTPGKRFKKTGVFVRPKPSDVKVVVAKYGEAHGIEFMLGTRAVNRMHLAGYKLPRLDGTTTSGRENDYDPEGFRPGILSRTHNGVLHVDEGDKLLDPVRDNFLDALQGKEIKPDQLRYAYPADSIILFTANKSTVFSGPLNDRMFLLEIPYTGDRDTSYRITRKAYHGEITEASQIPLGDTHNEKAFRLRDVVMPTILERAVDALYIQFRKEYTGVGKDEISSSQRSKFDALDLARAKLVYDRIFYEATPHIVDAERTMVGIEYALTTRVQEPDAQRVDSSFQALHKWVREEYPKILKQEEDTWWCRTYQALAIANTQIPELEGHLTHELASYEKDPTNALPAFEKVKRAYESRAPAIQRAKIQYPFMNYLFKEQPRFAHADKDQVTELIAYYMESRKNTVCQLPTPSP